MKKRASWLVGWLWAARLALVPPLRTGRANQPQGSDANYRDVHSDQHPWNQPCASSPLLLLLLLLFEAAAP